MFARMQSGEEVEKEVWEFYSYQGKDTTHIKTHHPPYLECVSIIVVVCLVVVRVGFWCGMADMSVCPRANVATNAAYLNQRKVNKYKL